MTDPEIYEPPELISMLARAQRAEHEATRLLTEVRRVDQKYGPFNEFAHWREVRSGEAAQSAVRLREALRVVDAILDHEPSAFRVQEARLAIFRALDSDG